LHIDAALSGDNVADSARIWVEDRGVQVRVKDIRRGPRVGIDYAGPYYAARPWRFWIDVAVGVAPHRK
jgi:DNA-3-methyladenine glycosylase